MNDDDFASDVEAITDGWKTTMGVHFVRATASEVIAEMVVGPMHRQPLGIVHGGVHAGLVEAGASVGANIPLLQKGQYAVGLENHTSFLRAVREGTLRAIGKPIHAGRQSVVWEVSVVDDSARVAATGRVRLQVIQQGSVLGGRAAGV